VTSPIAPTPIATAAGAASAGTAAPDQQGKLKKAAEAFEAVLLRQMLGSMRSASLGDGVFDSSATEQFRDMADAKTADSMAHKGVFGIADLLMKQYGATAAPGVAQKTGAPGTPGTTAATKADAK
jgi:flagellar protein FlgJ